jgi:hypothetical protein
VPWRSKSSSLTLAPDEVAYNGNIHVGMPWEVGSPPTFALRLILNLSELIGADPTLASF